MGEIADAIIEGEICEICMTPLEQPMGFPFKCASCRREAQTEKKRRMNRVKRNQKQRKN